MRRCRDGISHLSTLDRYFGFRYGHRYANVQNRAFGNAPAHKRGRGSVAKIHLPWLNRSRYSRNHFQVRASAYLSEWMH